MNKAFSLLIKFSYTTFLQFSFLWIDFIQFCRWSWNYKNYD